MRRTNFFVAAALLCQAALWAQVERRGFQQADALSAGRGGRGVAGNAVPLPRAEAGKPFSATAVTQTTQTLADGTHVSQTTSMLQYRDAEGRVRTETTEPGGAASEPAKIITIGDPVAAVSYRLDTAKKTVVKLGPVTPSAAAGARGGRGGGARGGVAPSSSDSAPRPTIIRERLGELADQAAALYASTVSNNTSEDLGTAMVNGVSATGTRVTTVVRAGAIGNDREFHSVSERWFSPDLNLLVKSVNTDPRFGSTTYELTNISRAAPDPSLFRVPAGYRQLPSMMPNTVEAIEFRGLGKIPADTARAMLLIKPGDTYDEDALRRDFAALWRSGRFSDVQLQTERGPEGGMVVRFLVTERP